MAREWRAADVERRERRMAELLRRIEADLGHALEGEYRALTVALIYAFMSDPDDVG